MRHILRNSLLLLLSLQLAQEGFSQVKVSGTIKDSNSTFAPGIAVLLRPSVEKKLVAYTYSNNHGYYELIIKKIGEYSLTVQGLGYESQELPIVISTLNEASIHQDIILNSRAFELEEVEINAENPIITKKDTITINTKVFVDGTEEVAEDILRKLPGIEVSNDGTISVQGKQVDKVLVEGDDLFEKGYKLLTKNLNAGVIDKVEILEHFSENPLLKNIQDSDKVALNMTLKKDQKSTLFGNTSLGLGTEKFYEGKINLISFREKSKYYLFANANNRGIDATGDIYQLVYPDLFTAPMYVGDGESADRYVEIVMPTPNLRKSRFKFNNGELVSLNSIFNPSKKVKLKTLGYFTSDENSFLSDRIYQFDVPPVTFTNTESYQLRKNTKLGYAKLDALITIGKDDRLDYIGRFNKGKFRDRASLLFNSESLLEDSRVEILFTDQRITYTRKLAGKNAIQLTGRYIYDEKPEIYDVNTFLYEDLFPGQTDIETVQQKNYNKLNYAGLEAMYITNRSRTYMEVITGISSRNQRLTSDLFLIDSNDSLLIVGGDYANRLKNNLDDFYAKVNYKYSFKGLQLKTDIELHQYNSATIRSNAKSKNTPLVLVPRVGIIWLPNKKINFIASYKYNNSPITTRDLRTGYVLTSYRNFSRGLTNFQLLPGNHWFSAINYGSWADSFSLNASAFINSSPDYLSTNRRIDPNYSLSENILLEGKRFTGMSANMSQYLKRLSSSIRLTFNFNETQYENSINNSDLRSLNIKSYTYGGEFKSIITSSFDFNIGTKWVRSIVDTGSKSVNLDNTSFLDLIWQPNSNINISLKNERYYFGSLMEENSFYFSDLKAKFKLIPNKLTLHFLASNIFNTNTFRNYSINETGFSSSNFRLLPRYFFLQADYRF
ncbi:MAG: hypothetical protein HKN89_06255 [Eudoraea sp.]|nr:hypothetical protein [Eudoraea sp.]